MATLPEHIENFLSQHVTAVDHLDILVLLFNSPQTEWTAGAVAQIVHCPPDKAARHLDRLKQDGFLSVKPGSPPRYAYRPRGGLGPSTLAMVEFYRERPVSVIRRIYDQAQDPVRAFADAFQLKKEE